MSQENSNTEHHYYISKLGVDAWQALFPFIFLIFSTRARQQRGGLRITSTPLLPPRALRSR